MKKIIRAITVTDSASLAEQTLFTYPLTPLHRGPDPRDEAKSREMAKVKHTSRCQILGKSRDKKDKWQPRETCRAQGCSLAKE